MLDPEQRTHFEELEAESHRKAVRVAVRATSESKFGKTLESRWRNLLGGDESTLDADASGTLFFRPRTGFLSPEVGDTPDELEVGDRLGDFELIRVIGRGGMGIVWEARQTSVDRPVALKVVRPDRVSSSTHEALEREARAGGRLHHPSIVEVYSAGETNGRHWLAQEFVDGECTLADFLREVSREEELPADYDRRIALFFYQLAEALEVAHAAGVTHRDLKPSNILISELDRPKLTDFGLARLGEDEELAVGLRLEGTPRYMSPEQVAGNVERIGPKSDVFSLGTILYQSLTLEYPFAGERLPDVMEAIVRAEPIPPRELRPSIAPDLEAIVAKALAKERSERYADMHELSRDLARFLDYRPVSARASSALERTRMFVRRNLELSATVGFAAVLVVLVGVMAYFAREARASSRNDQREVSILRASTAMNLGALDRAETVFANERANGALSEELLVLESLNLILQRRYLDAEQPLAELRELVDDEQRARVFSHLAAAAAHFLDPTQSSHSLARAEVDRAIALEPDWVSLHCLRAEISTQMRERAEARLSYLAARDLLAPAHPLHSLFNAEIACIDRRWDDVPPLLEGLELEDSPHLAYRQRAIACLSALLRMEPERVIELTDELDEETVRVARFWQWRGLAFFLLAQASTGPDHWEALLDKAWEATEVAESLAFFPGSILENFAIIEELRNHRHSTSESESLERLRALDPTSSLVEELDSNRTFREIEERRQAGEDPDQIHLELEDFFQRTPDHAFCAVLLAQHLTFTGEPLSMDAVDQAASYLDQALEDRNRAQSLGIEDAYSIGTQWRPSEMTQTFWTTRLWVLGHTDRDAEFARTRQILEQELEGLLFVSASEYLTYAETLFTVPNFACHDRERAGELLAGYTAAAGLRRSEDTDAFHQALVEQFVASEPGE